MALYILGGGTSAYFISKELRNQGYTQDIHILSSEYWLPYNRLLLPNYLRNKGSLGRTFFVDMDWYNQNRVFVHAGIAASIYQDKIILSVVNQIQIDSEDLTLIRAYSIVQPDSNLFQELEVEVNDIENMVIWACGAHALIPDFYQQFGDKVQTWRTIEDTVKIRSMMEKDQKLTIVGGSFISMEMAMSAHSWGNDQTQWLVKSPNLFRDDLDVRLQGELIRKWQSYSSIKLCLNTSIVGQAEDTSLVLNTGKAIQVDKLLLGTGIKSNIETQNLTNTFSINSDSIHKESPTQFIAGDLVLLKDSKMNEIIKCGSYYQTVKIAKYLVQQIVTGIEPDQQVFEDILQTPYQIQFAGKSLRACGLICSPLLNSKVVQTDRELRQEWLFKDGMLAGYVSIAL